jgi:lipoprotein-releasing system permease protein
MFQPLELFIGLRYTRAKRRNHFISFISLASIAGIVVGVMALIVVLSVMNGFEKELRERTLSMAAHASVSGIGSRLSPADVKRLDAALAGRAHVVAFAPYIDSEGMLSSGRRVTGAAIRGIEPGREKLVSEIHTKMVEGSLDNLRGGEFGLVVGRELALALGVGVGDKVTVFAPQAGVTPAGVIPRMRRFTVVGVFEVGMHQYDRGVAYMHVRDAAPLFQLGRDVSGLRLKLDDMFRAPRITAELNEALGTQYWVTDWTRQHANFFRALKMEKTVMFIILFLIVGVAAFNIVSTLVMVVTDKQSDIAILRTLGMTPGKVMMIFIIQGSVIGVLGTLAGVAAGVAVALNVEVIVAGLEALMGVKILSPDVYYISDIPSDLRYGDVIRVALMAFILSILATLYPAWRASRTQPAEALRYE